MVVGAGPAGAAAAMEAAAVGVRTVLLEAEPATGGQASRDALAQSGVEARFGQTVWSVSGEYRIDVLGPQGPDHWRSKALIAATGALERVVPFPGWTQPGVIGLVAATILTAAGQRVLVAGSGPLLVEVAGDILNRGAKVAAVVDVATPRAWAARLPAMAARPDLLARDVARIARLRLAGVPVLSGTTIASVEPAQQGLRAVIRPVDASGRQVAGGPEREFEVDAVAVGHGLIPSTDITRLLRVAHRWDPLSGGWHAVLDDGFRTSRPGFYLAGDCGGIQGAAALQGRLAGLTAALDLGRLSQAEYGRRVAPLRRRLHRARRFGVAMAQVMAVRPGQIADIPSDVLICRCEDVTRAEIEAAAADGARDVNQLKAWTRCGMGPCQGRMCGDIAAAVLAQVHATGREAVGLFTGRTPLRPLPLDQLTGEYGYADIALPPPAPL